MKIDTTNEDPRYWEDVLSRHALSEKQLGMDIPNVQASEAEERAVREVVEEVIEEILAELVDEALALTEKRETARPVSNSNPDFEILRTQIDSKDRFMQGHQIRKVRRRERENHDWAYSDETVQALINGAKGLSKWQTDPRQRLRAARWAGVIHYYYRMNMPIDMVAKEMAIPKKTVRSVLKRIRRVLKGRDAANRERRK